MKKIVLVIGTKREAIKMVPIILKMKQDNKIEPIIIITGEHTVILEKLLKEFIIKVNYKLEIEKELSIIDFTTQLLKQLEKIFEEIDPDIVLVQGNTTIGVTVSFAASCKRIPIGHLDASFKKHNKSLFPEEMNRKLINSMADIHFVQTEQAKRNLGFEGIQKYIYVIGNTANDLFQYTLAMNYTNEILDQMKQNKTRYIFLTIHHEENEKKYYEKIFNDTIEILEQNKSIELILSLPVNSCYRKEEYNYFSNHPKVNVIEPLNVIGLHNYMKHAYLIITDSTGIKDGACNIGKPVLVFRDNYEQLEDKQKKTVKDLDLNFIQSCVRLLEDEKKYQQLMTEQSFYRESKPVEKLIACIKMMDLCLLYDIKSLT